MPPKNGVPMKTLIFLSLISGLMLAAACSSVGTRFRQGVRDEFQRQPVTAGDLLTEEKMSRLPDRLQSYLKFTGAAGKPIPVNFRLTFSANMIRKRGTDPIHMPVDQYNFFGEYARHFTMGGRVLFIPFDGLHQYTRGQASFQVRVASLFNQVDLRGDTLTTAETVTILNDLCLYNPAALTDPRVEAVEAGPDSVKVTLTAGKYRVSAVLVIDPSGRLVTFISDDRYALEADGQLRKVRWSTPVSDWKEVAGRRVPGWGAAVYQYPEGDFRYADFTLTSIAYDLPGLQD